MPYIPHTDKDVAAMCGAIGVDGEDDLFEVIPEALKAAPLDVPEGLSEAEAMRRVSQLAAKNANGLASFLGAGFYDHHIPEAVNALSGISQFYTAYTPYQPEASQGTLTAIFEYQTCMARLLGMECANASVYDGGSALQEAAMMAVRATRRKKLVICETVSPIYRTMLTSHTRNLGLDLVVVPHAGGCSDFKALAGAMGKDTAAVIVQNPTFFGTVQDYADLFERAGADKVLGVMGVYPVMQAVLKTPGEMGADIAVAEGQSLGLPLSFGGPYLGVMTCTKKLVRQMPGRIAGRTKDHQGRTGYVLTLQAREQHIRRQKATSNICSNQALCALRSVMHVCLLGPEGLRRTAELAIEKAHYAAERLAALPGVELMSDAPFGNEFALTLPMPAYTAIDKLTARGYVPGFPLGRYYKGLENGLLVACTETTRREDIGILAEMLGGLIA